MSQSICCCIEYERLEPGDWESFGGVINPEGDSDIQRGLTHSRGLPVNPGWSVKNADLDTCSVSWMTLKELNTALKNAKTEWRAIIAAMNSLESSGHPTRIIFWFEN